MTADKKETGYWLFQCHPKMMDLPNALRAEALDSFPVKAHLSKIREGDLVVLWLSGPQAGAYALARVCSEVQDLSFSQKMMSYVLERPEAEKMVSLNIQYNLWQKPITKDLLNALPSKDRFPAGVPGTTFRISPEQYEGFVKLIRQQDLLEEPPADYDLPPASNQALNLILYGPPGTGKTYQTVNYALSIIENKPLAEIALENRRALLKRYSEYQEKEQIAMLTFHASFSYEDFVEGIKPLAEDQQLSYEVQSGLFKSICQKAQTALENASAESPVQKYVLIIDEINRGNIPAIFGELITLIDADKRKGQPEEKEVLLPYSKMSFSVPSNLYLIGTMNTSDRSITHLDAALRRRFAFQAFLPDSSLLKQSAGTSEFIRGIQLNKMLEAINHRIRVLLDEDHTIGHGFFMNIQSVEQLKDVFYDYLIPQLREYFFNDLGKIGLILGNDFVEQTKQQAGKRIFAEFDYPFVEELLDKSIYHLKNREEIDETAFINIYNA
jgi:5-methylcytosine-specific restriction endonuclease McrBC GTP-binding regulatory subunit McrB